MPSDDYWRRYWGVIPNQWNMLEFWKNTKRVHSIFWYIPNLWTHWHREDRIQGDPHSRFTSPLCVDNNIRNSLCRNYIIIPRQNCTHKICLLANPLSLLTIITSKNYFSQNQCLEEAFKIYISKVPFEKSKLPLADPTVPPNSSKYRYFNKTWFALNVLQNSDKFPR